MIWNLFEWQRIAWSMVWCVFLSYLNWKDHELSEWKLNKILESSKISVCQNCTKISPKLNMSRMGKICRTWAIPLCWYTHLSESWLAWARMPCTKSVLGETVSPTRDFLKFLPRASRLSENQSLEQEITLKWGTGAELTHFSFPQTLAHNFAHVLLSHSLGTPSLTHFSAF